METIFFGLCVGLKPEKNKVVFFGKKSFFFGKKHNLKKTGQNFFFFSILNIYSHYIAS